MGCGSERARSAPFYGAVWDLGGGQRGGGGSGRDGDRDTGILALVALWPLVPARAGRKRGVFPWERRGPPDEPKPMDRFPGDLARFSNDAYGWQRQQG